MEPSLNLKAFVLGATGAVGRLLVSELLSSPHWTEITVVVRRRLKGWDKLPLNEQKKLKVILKPTLDVLEDVSKWNLTGYSTVFCCLGSQKKYGEKIFVKVDYTYPLFAANLARHFNVQHYSIVTTERANPKSLALYFKTKGEVEEALKALEMPHLSIFRPGILLHRMNDMRLKENIIGRMLFIPKNETENVAKALRIEAEIQHKSPLEEKVKVYQYKMIDYIAKHNQLPKIYNLLFAEKTTI